MTEPNPEQKLLMELLIAIIPLKVRGTPLRDLDTKLRRAVFDAEAHLRDLGIHLRP